ncbi:MAG: T9SS type A sorting domain-containing protein [Ignavibacteriaceae bacterium]|nr:T9SS type A sorting domain-containing protein [Ignavibacteriaceae bacterium]
MKTKIVLLILGISYLLLAQSSVSVGTGSLILIEAGSDISAGSRSGTFMGDGTFNSSPLSVPYIVTKKPTNVLNTSATINATVNPKGNETTYHFSYGTDPDNLSMNTSVKSAGSGSEDIEVGENISGLTANTIYYYIITAENSNGTSVSDKRVLFADNSITRTHLVLWLRADKGITSSSGSVSGWDDISSSNNNASQNTSANQPSIAENVINGNPALNFNGISSKLTLPTSISMGIQSNPYEMFIVAKSSSGDVQFLIAGGANEHFEYHLNGAAGARFIPVTSFYLDKEIAGSYTNGNAHVFSAKASISGGAVSVDGIEGGTSSSSLLSSNGSSLLLGARSDNSYYLNGSIAEVILYNSNLSLSDRSTVEQYLAARYGITSGALPIELTSFSLECGIGSVELKWTTATEKNNHGFEIERSSIIENWEMIAFVQGNGNSNSPKEYSFIDNSPLSGFIKYRLKQIDNDGQYSYSNEVEVEIENIPTEYTLYQNYPNPFNPSTTIKFGLPKDSKVTLEVYNIIGEKVTTLINQEMSAGYHNVNYSGNELSTGIYIYRITANEFTSTRKFVLMK